MLPEQKKQKLTDNLKTYCKRFLNGSITELDESGTRIMTNHFLTDVLGFAALEEVRTEYMIKGTYADYMIQVAGKRHFLVEVKAFSINLNESHLRQAVNYGANEGVEWALLTNGRCIDFYKILFEKPIQHKKIFSFDLSDSSCFKESIEYLQFLTRDAIIKNGLDLLWNKTLAITPESLSKFLLGYDIVNSVRKEVNKQYNTKYENEHIQGILLKIISEKIDISKIKVPKLAAKVVKKAIPTPAIVPVNCIDEKEQQ